jgi:hypothetical protein
LNKSKQVQKEVRKCMFGLSIKKEYSREDLFY